MDWKSGSAGLVMTLLLGGCATVPSAVPSASAPLAQGHQASAEPAGFISFCLRYPDQCTATPGGKDTLVLDTPTWLLLNAVNTAVNDAIWPEDDLKHYGRAEYWTIPTDGYGDCEDYAVTKRKDLLQAGLPAQALRLAVVYSPAAGRHAVLTVVTDKGDYVLDNLSGEIQSWRSTGYTWIERQDSSNPVTWVSLFPAYAGQETPSSTATGSASANLSDSQQMNPQAPTTSTAVSSSGNASMQLSDVGKATGVAQ